MFESLKAWLNVPYSYFPFEGRNGTGAPSYSEAIHGKCYPAGKLATVVNVTGAEVVSSLQLYVPGTTQISTADLVHFSGNDYPIKSISVFYRNGVPDIKVVYL